MKTKTLYEFLCLSGSLIAFASGQLTPTPVTELDTASYIGKWYQAYGSRSVQSFETFGSCVTAEYTVTDVDGTIGVKNGGRALGQFFPDLDILPEVAIDGFAVQSPTVQGQLQVSFGRIPYVWGLLGKLDPEEAPYEDPGNYWIFELGPIVNGQYDWALVTNGEDRGQLYILVRDIDRFEELYEEELLATVLEYGFTESHNEPVKTNQDNCDE